MSDYEKGYYDAVEDFEAAMKKAEVDTIGPAGYLSYNDPKIYLEELKKLHDKRFPESSARMI